MRIDRLSTLVGEILKTLIELNPSFMRNIVNIKETDKLTRDEYKLNLNIPLYLIRWLLAVRALASLEQNLGINFFNILN